MEAVGFCLVRSAFWHNAAICDRFTIGVFTSGNEEYGIVTFWRAGSYPLENSFTHISASGTCRNCLFLCDILVMVSITVLDSKWIHASCDVRICVARAYLKAVWSILG